MIMAVHFVVVAVVLYRMSFFKTQCNKNQQHIIDNQYRQVIDILLRIKLSNIT